MSKHTLQELASERQLWEEHIDPDDNAPFDDFTQSQREEIIRQSFGSDFNDDGTPTNTHGGPREGAGRKPLDPNDPTEKRTIHAPASTWRMLEHLGDGNRSAGLREIVAAYERMEDGE